MMSVSRQTSIHALSAVLASALAAGSLSGALESINHVMSLVSSDTGISSLGEELHGRVMRADFPAFYSHRTEYHPDGTYDIVDSKGVRSEGKWWIEDKIRLCFVRKADGIRACWRYRKMYDGQVYTTVSPYDGSTVYAYLEPAGSSLR